MTPAQSFREACGRVSPNDGHLLGSGFLVTQKHVLTAAHVVEDRPGAKYRILFPKTSVEARVLSSDPNLDCAVLETDRVVEDITPISLGLDVAPGDEGVLYGYSRVLDSSISLEVRVQDVFHRDRAHGGLAIIVLPVAPLGRDIFVGFSGGPLILREKAVGLLTQSIHTKSESTAILSCVRIQDAIKLLPPEVVQRLTQPPVSSAPERSASRPPVLCVSALDEELDYLYEMPLGWGDIRLHPDGVSFRRGSLVDGTDIIATSARGFGLVATAVLAAKALKEWAPSVAMLIGICGGRKEKGVNIGDIIAPDKCFHYQFGAFEDGEVVRELQVENTEGQIIDLIDHMRRTRVLAEIQQSVPTVAKSPNTLLQCHVGPMASADLVVKDVNKLGEAIEADRKTIGVDMESYAFLRAAKLAGTRWAFVAKAVTDFADAKKDDEYRKYAKYVSAHFAVRLARVLVAGFKAA